MASFNLLVICMLCFLSLQAPKFAWSRIPSILKLFPGDNQLELVEENGQRLLHVVFNVGNLNRSIEFYQVCFGMQLLQQVDRPDLNSSYALVSFGPQESNFVLRLVYNYGVDSIDVGTTFGHLGVLSRDAYQTADTVVANGGIITVEIGPTGDGSLIFGFVRDPNGYLWEITQTDQPTPESLDHVNFLVTDIDPAINFYERALGMRNLSYYNEPGVFAIASVGYGELLQTTVLELTFNSSVTNYTKGNGFSHLAISTDDVYTTAETVALVTQELGGQIIRPPGPVLDNRVNVTSFLDPEGFEIVLVENEDSVNDM